MLHLLTAKNIESVYYFLSQKIGQDFIHFILGAEALKPWLTWNIASFTDLSNYISSGQNGIFDLEQTPSNGLVLVRGAENLGLDEKSLTFLKNLNLGTNLENIFVYVETGNVDAATKKLILKHEIALLEAKEIDKKIKSEIAKKYTQSEYPNQLNKLNSATLNHLSDLDLCANIFDTIDYLVLSQTERWDYMLSNQVETQPEIFRLSFSKNPKLQELSDIYKLFQNQEANQLLLTVLYMRLEGKPELKDWLTKLIQVDYLSKTKSNSTLWAKLWLYDVIQSI